MNLASGRGAFVGGGGGEDLQGENLPNRAIGFWSSVTAGALNTAEGDWASIGGGYQNSSTGPAASIAGGYQNTATGNSAAIGGGFSNICSGTGAATIAGGYQNTSAGDASAVGGGLQNASLRPGTTIAGGLRNTNTGFYATIGGGAENIADGYAATIAGGTRNISDGSEATVAGGLGNISSGVNTTISGGYYNSAIGDYGTIPGGYLNSAGGTYSFAAGRQAKANHSGAFVWADSHDADIASSTNDQFTARASGGVRFFTDSNATTGVVLPPGGVAWLATSDRNLKENFRAVDTREVLQKVVDIPIQTWNMKTQDPAIRHIGPMAQDFQAAFRLGEDDRHINTVDADGVALAAIQGLNQKLEEQLKTRDTEIEKLRQMISELKQLLQATNSK